MSDDPSELQITKAGTGDLERVLPLFEAYLEFYHRPPDSARAREFLKDRLERADSVIFLAHRASGELVGFAQLYPTFASLAMAPWWILYDLYVVPSARRHGVASRLLNAARELAADTHAAGLGLDTASDNPARRLYEEKGWKRDDVFVHYELYL